MKRFSFWCRTGKTSQIMIDTFDTFLLQLQNKKFSGMSVFTSTSRVVSDNQLHHNDKAAFLFCYWDRGHC